MTRESTTDRRERDQLLLEVAQIALDVAGIVDPTPVADTAATLLAVYRGDFLGAGLSAVGILPYVGDLAKAGKLKAYGMTLRRALRVAADHPGFERQIGPILEALHRLLSSIPLRDLTPQLASHVRTLRRPFDSMLAGGRAVRGLSLTDRLLIARFGSTKVGGLVRRNVEVVVGFLGKADDPATILQFLKGMDLHKPVEVVRFRKGDLFEQYVPHPWGSQQMGRWFKSLYRSGRGWESLGIARGSRELQRFRAIEDVSFLKSTAADVIDTWTPRRGIGFAKTGLRLGIDHRGQIGVVQAERKWGAVAKGGGEQLLFEHDKMARSFERLDRTVQGKHHLADRLRQVDRRR